MRAGGSFNSHLNRQQEENIDWLLDEVGLHPDLVARRLGLTRNTLDKNRSRRGFRITDPSAESEARQDARQGKVSAMRGTHP